MDSSIGRVVVSRKSILFPLCTGSNPINAFISVSSFLLYNMYYFICLDNSFNIYTKCPLNGVLANTKTYMRDVTECVNSIGYGLIAVVKAIVSIRNGLELFLNYIQNNCIYK